MKDLVIELENGREIDLPSKIIDGVLWASSDHACANHSTDLPINEAQADKIIAHLQEVFRKPINNK